MISVRIHRAGLLRRSQSGQALAETAIGLAGMTLVIVGILEFGRAFMISNAVTNAARVGARAAAMEPATNRNGDGMIIDKTAIIAAVKDEIATSSGQAVADAVTVTVTQPDFFVARARVTVSGSIPYLFNLVGPHFNLTRTVTYRDQAR